MQTPLKLSGKQQELATAATTSVATAIGITLAVLVLAILRTASTTTGLVYMTM